MLEFTATAATTVTITASSFADDADAHAVEAATLAATAAGHLALARLRAAVTPAGFTTPGGADAATVTRFIADDLDDLRRSAAGARRAATAARTADTAQHAGWAEADAGAYAANARFTAGSIRRFLAYLPA